MWKPQIVLDNPTYPYIIIDNWYTPEEEFAVWKELDYYISSPNGKRAENEKDGAKTPEGTSLVNANRFYPEAMYTSNNREFSPILYYMKKQRTKEFHDIVRPCIPYSRSFLGCNSDYTLVTYYDENDHYEEHQDVFQWTMCIWFYREPKGFDGGDFVLTDINATIEIKHNRTIVFPSCFRHKVIPVKKHDTSFGTGRFTISHFYYWV